MFYEYRFDIKVFNPFWVNLLCVAIFTVVSRIIPLLVSFCSGYKIQMQNLRQNHATKLNFESWFYFSKSGVYKYHPMREVQSIGPEGMEEFSTVGPLFRFISLWGLGCPAITKLSSEVSNCSVLWDQETDKIVSQFVWLERQIVISEHFFCLKLKQL